MGLQIVSAEFIKSITHPKYAPEPRPAVAFAGRSNVGKSSLINRLVNKKRLARTSNTPGRTQEINFFNIEDRYYFVDLPGYGYAKVPPAIHRKWGPMMERFFQEAEGLRLIVLILDVRRDPTGEDFQMIQWLENRGLPFIFAVTKCDKLSKTQLAKRLREIQQGLGLEDDSALVPVSSLTGAGVMEMLQVIRLALESEPEPAPAEPETGIETETDPEAEAIE